MNEFIERNKLGYNSLTNFDIYDIVRELNILNFRGVFMRDTLPNKPRTNECGIMNFNTSDQSGSHWVCWYKNGQERIYFDSFGCITPEELQKYLKTKSEYNNNTLCIKRNTEQVQQPNTQICGQLCLYVLKNLSDGMSFQDVLKNNKIIYIGI